MKDLTNVEIGGLKYLSPTGQTDKHRRALWNCRCLSCDKCLVAHSQRSNRNIGCGCQQKKGTGDFTREPGSKHQKRIYTLWRAMHSRCYNSKHKCFSRYGGRGITVEQEWHGRNGFYSFCEWSNRNGYYENPDPQKRSESASLDRIDSDGSYGPNNCRWITLGENADKARQERQERIKFKNNGGHKNGKRK